MTPRLKVLIAGFVLSLIYAIADYVARNSDKPVVEVKREVKKRPKTARISKERIRRIKAKNSENEALSSRKNQVIFKADFAPLSNEILALEGWGRNPFVVVKEKPMDLSPNLLKLKFHQRSV